MKKKKNKPKKKFGTALKKAQATATVLADFMQEQRIPLELGYQAVTILKICIERSLIERWTNGPKD